ncbi:baseplate wedge subunit [Vibrio phage EniLVp02]
MAKVYRAKITNEYRTQNLLNFADAVGDGDDQNTIYLMFGRPEPWADNEQDINFAPPYPDDSPDGQADAWSRSLGFVKIPREQLKAVIPRRDWGDPELGVDALQFQIGDIVVTNTMPINRHPSALAGYMVYRCVDVPDVGACTLDDSQATFTKSDCIALGGRWNAQNSPGTVINIPNGTGDAIDTEDGYLWEYLYTIPPSEVVNSVTKEYITVPFPQDILNDPEGWGLKNEIQWDEKANYTLFYVGANRLRFRAKLSGGEQFQQLTVPGNPGYRQMAIILNPILHRDDTTEDAVKATAEAYLPSELESTSGKMIYIENRQPIFKAPDQVEEFNLIFQF